MSALRTLHEKIVDAVRPPHVVHAHCDIPCGIYDPHEAQIAALTVVRMTQLIGELPKPGAGAKPEDVEAYQAKLARYVAVKETHSERVKAELRILWADYFTPDHLKQYPTLHETFWSAMKAASKARQGTNPGRRPRAVEEGPGDRRALLDVEGREDPPGAVDAEVRRRDGLPGAGVAREPGPGTRGTGTGPHVSGTR